RYWPAACCCGLLAFSLRTRSMSIQSDADSPSSRNLIDSPLRMLKEEAARFLRGLRQQLRVITALLLREAGGRRGRRIPFGFALLMVEPLLIIGTIVLLFYCMNRAPIYGSNLVLFIATGVFPVYLFIHTALGIREPVQLAHLGRYPIEQPLDSVIA